MTSNNKSIKPRALTDNDIKWFFEALGEYGKDFNNIHNYITQRSEKAGLQADQIRSREQIRNFYNRLYNKLSQLITISNDVDKVTQELYLLINYGEIWKKFGFKFNTRTWQLLNGLVNDGHTTYKSKKAYVRFRTPTCKALRRLHEISVDDKLTVLTSSEVPKDVLVEFHPATHLDWLHVQSISQNPRIRARLSLQKRVSSVINFLENKWNVREEKLFKSTDQWLKLPSSSSHEIQSIDDCTNGSVLSCQDPIVRSIRLKPSARVHDLNAITITRVVPDCQMNLSLSAYLAKIMPDSKCKVGAVINVSSNNSSKQPQRAAQVVPTDYIEERTSESIDQAQKLKNLNGLLASCMDNSRTNCGDEHDQLSGQHGHVQLVSQNSLSCENSNNLSRIFDESNQSVEFPMPPPNMTYAEYFGMEKHNSNPNHTEQNFSSINKDDLVAGSANVNENVANGQQKMQMIDPKKISSGWTYQDDSMITIGELYLAFKCPEKIVLEYEFDFNNNRLVNNSSFLFKLLTAASVALASVQKANTGGGGVGGSGSGSGSGNSDLQNKEQNALNINNPRAAKRRKIVPTTISRTVSSRGTFDVASSSIGQQQLNHYQHQYQNYNNKSENYRLGLTDQDIELNNQRVEDQLKQLQPTRLIFRSRP